MPPEWAHGFSGTLDFGTVVTRLGRRRETVKTRELPDRRWTGTKGLFRAARGDEFAGFCRARSGAFYGFLLTDLTDCSTNPVNPKGPPVMTDQYLGEGDGVRTRFPIRRTYASVPNELLQRLGLDDRMVPIINEVDDRLATKLGLPLGTTLTSTVSVGGVSAGTFSFDYFAREFVIDTPPAAGEPVAWGGYYDWPVALAEETDNNLEKITEAWGTSSVPNIQLEILEYDRFIPETDDPGGFGTLTWASGVPLIQKSVRKHWYMNPLAGSLNVQVEEPTRHNPGGPHLCLYNGTANAVTVRDAMTGATMFTLGAAGSATANAQLFVRDDGSTVQWLWVFSE